MRKWTLIFWVSILTFNSTPAFSQPRFYPPVNVGPPISTSAHEFDPFLTVDGKKLFFVSLRDTTLSIWFSERTDTGWTNPTKLGPQINAGISGKWSPSVSPDGQKLYYVDDSREGFYWDIWVSTFDSSINDWGTPINVGPPVNTSGAEFSAHLAPDGRRLYFTSDGNLRCGIYMSVWNDTSWSDPQLQWGSCTPEYPSVTADGQWLYFDNWVSGTRKIFTATRDSSGWILPAYNLQFQIGDSSWTPSIIPSGDSLFFNSNRTTEGNGGSDIWVARRIVLGDLNLDIRHSPADLVLELNKVFLGEPYPALEERGDMNCDAAFTAADVVRLILLVFQNELPEC